MINGLGGSVADPDTCWVEPDQDSGSLIQNSDPNPALVSRHN